MTKLITNRDKTIKNQRIRAENSNLVVGNKAKILKIAYLYPDLLNLYGDRGNTEILYKRAANRGYNVQITELSLGLVDLGLYDLVFMGGGPDLSQKEMYKDLVEHKKSTLTKFIEEGGVGLFICGSYQLLGNYYKSADGSVLDGLKIFNMYTEHFGNKKPRCVGNLVCELNASLRADFTFNSLNKVGSTFVGFENHGGRTFLHNTLSPLAKVKTGYGNNGEDKTEGVLYKNVVGTYSHGPVLAKNPHLADYLIAKALKVDYLAPLDDNLINLAHKTALKLKQ